MNDRPEKRNFFERLFSCCEGCTELRIIKNGRVNQHFFELVDHEGISECCAYYPDWNIYFGVGTRDASGSGGKANVVNIPALWTDIDFKDIEPKEANKRIGSFPYKPSALILTGHGAHLYWILQEPAERSEFDRIEDLLRRIRQHFDGDPAACEVARVLRVPGSINVKKEPVSVKLHYLRDFTYNLEDFDFLPEVKTVKVCSNGKSVNPPEWMVDAFKGIPEGGNDCFAGRDITGTKLAGYWIGFLSPGNVFKLLQCWNIRNTPPLSDYDLKKIINSTSKYSKETKKQGNKYDFGF